MSIITPADGLRRALLVASIACLLTGGFAGGAAANYAWDLAVETGGTFYVDDTVVGVEANVTTLENASSATVWVEYRPSGTLDWNGTANRSVTDTGVVTFNLTGLDPGTTYDYRAVALAEDQLDTGAVRQATTDAPPAVRTVGSTNVGETSATLHGNLTDLGGAAGATVGFEYRQLGSGTWLSTGGENANATGPYSTQASGLDPATDYEFRAVAEADDGETATGDVLTFTTDAANSPPSVDSLSATEDNPRNRHAEITVDWQVADVDGNLATVVVTITDASGQVVLTDQTAVGGTSASGSLYERVKHGGRQTYTVSVTVTDGADASATRETAVDT